MIKQIEPCFGEEERRAVYDYMSSGAWLTEHKKTQEFEEKLADYLGVQHCVVVSNGTAALFVALKALGIGYGDEVIVPDYTMIATANAVVLAGAAPVFVDILLDDLCLDLELAKDAIGPNTKAIIVVDLNGRSPNMRLAQQIVSEYSITLIEDAAQAFGSKYNGQYLGTFGDVGCFSLSPQKIISTGQGGFVVTNNDELAKKMRQVKNFGRRKVGEHYHEVMGWNFKFTDLQAVIGLEQFKKLPYRISAKKSIYSLYRGHLRDIETSFIETDLNDVCPWYMDILVEDPNALIAYLKKQGIDARRVYPAIHSQPAYANPANHDYYFPNSAYVAKHGLWLPSSSSLRIDQIRWICEEVRKFYQKE